MNQSDERAKGKISIDKSKLSKGGHVRSIENIFQTIQSKPVIKLSKDQSVHMNIENYNERRQAKNSKVNRNGVLTLKLKPNNGSQQPQKAEQNPSSQFKQPAMSNNQKKDNFDFIKTSKDHFTEPVSPEGVSPNQSFLKIAQTNIGEKRSSQPSKKDFQTI